MGEILKAIETHYNGHKFRSRLEARWALFFDEIGLNWLYEYEGFKLSNGYYLPDFYFPDVDCFAEVKPTKFSEKELKKCLELSRLKSEKYKTFHIDVILLDGKPELRTYEVVVNGGIFDSIVFLEKNKKYAPFYFGDIESISHLTKHTQWAADEANCARFERNGRY